MHVSKLIQATLAAAAAMPGCFCKGEIDFDLDTGVSQWTVDQILERDGLSSASEIECETLCSEVYQRKGDPPPTRIDECVADLDTGGAPDTADDAIVGSIQCSGSGQRICK
jgi:hypothetical protein